MSSGRLQALPSQHHTAALGGPKPKPSHIRSATQPDNNNLYNQLEMIHSSETTQIVIDFQLKVP
jgi:hypothetical protein